MVQQCAHCGSFDIIAGQDMFQCLQCGYHTHADGTAVILSSQEDSSTTKES